MRLWLWNLPEAVKMMLPPLNPFPTAGLVFNIANDACLTARKHLSTMDWARYSAIVTTRYIPYERALTLIVSINNSFEVSWRGSFEEKPACTTDQVVDEKWKVKTTLAKNTSRRPSSLRACSQTLLMVSSSAASACCTVAYKYWTQVTEGITVVNTWTSGYLFSMVSLRLGRLVPSKSMRYRCFAPVRGQRPVYM